MAELKTINLKDKIENFSTKRLAIWALLENSRIDDRDYIIDRLVYILGNSNEGFDSLIDGVRVRILDTEENIRIITDKILKERSKNINISYISIESVSMDSFFEGRVQYDYEGICYVKPDTAPERIEFIKKEGYIPWDVESKKDKSEEFSMQVEYRGSSNILLDLIELEKDGLEFEKI